MQVKGTSEGSPLARSAVPSSPSREGQTPVSFLALWHWVSATPGRVDRWSPQKLLPTLAESDGRVDVPPALPQVLRRSFPTRRSQPCCWPRRHKDNRVVLLQGCKSHRCFVPLTEGYGHHNRKSVLCGRWHVVTGHLYVTDGGVQVLEVGRQCPLIHCGRREDSTA